jgi:NIPSNAP
MHRRQFLATSLAASATTLAGSASAQTPASGSRDYYQIRRYQLQAGPQTKLAESYFSDALIPALTRMGMGPTGVFSLSIGQETPAYYSLITGPSAEAVAAVDFKLAEDAEFLKAADPFWSAPAAAPAFVRVDASLLIAFEGWPKLITPASGANPLKGKRIVQLRTYESPSYAAHVRKVEMFNKGEFDIFVKAGCRPVFFGDTLVGPRTPSLTYMLSFADIDELNAGWAKFVADPDWKKLSTSPRYAYESIVSNISNIILNPLAASQI